MKINKNITLNSQHFTSITDDTQIALADSQSLFLKTKMNEKYHHQIEHLPSITAQDLSSFFTLNPKLIGITGTNGKTTTSALIAHSLQTLGFKVALLGTRGFFINSNQITPKGLTTPTLLELYAMIEKAQDCDFFVMEVSSHAIIQERIAGLSFTLKAISNITSDHLDFHKTLQEYIRVKNSFFKQDCLEVINSDDCNIIQTPTSITYSLNHHAQFYAKNLLYTPTIKADIFHQNQFSPLSLAMCGRHNLYNAICAIATLSSLTQLPLQAITESLKDFQGVEGRMQIISHSPLIIVDFAHTHDGMEKILESFKGQKISVVFGAGGDRDPTKRPKMGKVAEQYAQKLYITSDNPRTEDPQSIIDEILQGISDTTKIRSTCIDRAKSIQQAIIELQNDEVLFVLGKGDETYQIIGEEKIHFDDRETILSMLESQKDFKKEYQ